MNSSSQVCALTEGINIVYYPSTLQDSQSVSVLVIKLDSLPSSVLQRLPADHKGENHDWEAVAHPLGKKPALHKAAQPGLPFLNGNSKSWFKKGKKKKVMFPGRLQALTPIKLLRWHRAFPPL